MLGSVEECAGKMRAVQWVSMKDAIKEADRVVYSAQSFLRDLHPAQQDTVGHLLARSVTRGVQFENEIGLVSKVNELKQIANNAFLVSK